MSSKIKNMLVSIIVLCVIAGTSGLLLGGINYLTYVDPETEAQNNFKKLSESNDNFTMKAKNEGNVVYFALSNGSTPIYAFLTKASGGYGGEVQMYVFIKDDKIYKIAQGANSETLFSKVEKAGFYDKFYGKSLSNISKFSTDKSELISGATMTSTAVTNAINTAVEYYKRNSLADVTVDLTAYEGIKKVQKDENKYYFTTEKKVFIPEAEENVTTAFVIEISKTEGTIISIIDNSDSYKAKGREGYIGKTASEINDSLILSGATYTDTSLNEFMKKCFEVYDLIKGDN